MLKDKGADIDAYDVDGYTPILRAIKIKCMASVQQLLKLGADVQGRTTGGMGYLDHALYSVRIMKMLYRRGARPRPVHTLLKAMEEDHKQAQDFLIKKKVKPDGNLLCRAAKLHMSRAALATNPAKRTCLAIMDIHSFVHQQREIFKW